MDPELKSDSSGAAISEVADHDLKRSRVGEPIAVVGMACRFPQANGVSAFWKLLEAGQNAVTEGDPGSGVGRTGELFQNSDVQSEACRFAAFIDEVDQFDASFFRISPVEAQHLDPQQRLMLETSWQALEDAGIDPDGLKGSRTGVYAGISNNEYRGLIMEVSNTSDPAPSLYTVAGTSYNTAIGRVAFALGLQGPAIALDTACSSSLVAVHQAVTGLQQGEADLALAGGVHTILSGRLLELRANAGMLAPDGRCKTFDASANGYVRGEGCGIIVLKRLSDAEADGDRIWGVIRGSALNQDGASQGLTVPNGEAQEQVIQDALRRASVLPSQVDYVEAHGTGTPVGDPIELEAMGAAYSEGRDPEQPLLVGSVKTNFGHLESAAGVAGIMKVLLAMKHGVIPKHLNFSTPTPAVDWDNLPIQVTSTPTAWPQGAERPPLAGVSGFGWSGTNAHVVIEGYDVPSDPSEGRVPDGPPQSVTVSLPEPVSDSTAPHEVETRATRLLPVSGKTDEALREYAERYVAWLDERESADDTLLSDLSWTASVGRSHFQHRAGVTYRDAASLRDGLKAIASGEAISGTGTASKIAFVYTGQGSQWFGMGEPLYRTEPVVRAILDRCEQIIQEERGVSLLDIMFGRENAKGDLYATEWAQPAVYALECALTAMWASLGVKPSVVIGHSLGEFAAAQTAGVFSLEDGLRFVAKRGALLSSVPEMGSMAAVFAPESQVEEAIREFNATSDGPGVGIGVDNGIHQVISGPADAVQALSERFESEDIRVSQLRTGQAFHSVLVEPALDELEEAYQRVSVSHPNIALVSNVTGRTVGDGDVIDSKYWRRHARQAVQFRTGIGTLAEMGVDIAIEVGPSAVLGPLVSMAWPGSADPTEVGETPSIVASLLRPTREITQAESDDAFITAVGEAYRAGLPISFPGQFAGEERRRIELPGYPFKRERHWIDIPRRRRAAAGHPLLGNRHESPRGEVMFETEMFPSDPAWLDDHRVFGRVIMPGALYGAVAAAASLSEGADSVYVEDLQLHSAMVFAEDTEDDAMQPGRRLQAVLNPPESGRTRQLEIYSKGETDEGWTLHAEAKVGAGDGSRGSANRVDVDNLRSGMSAQDVSEFYRARAEASINLGPMFRTLQSLWAGGGEAVGEVALPDRLDRGEVDLHPVLLDGCFQVLSAARHSAGGDDEITYLPFGWELLWVADRLPERLICHARLGDSARGAEGETPEVLTGDLSFYTPEGVEVGGLSGYTVKRATRAALLAATEGLQDLLYEITWRDRPLAPGMLPADFLMSPTTIEEQSSAFTQYLANEGVDADGRAGLLDDLERLSWRYALLALERLGWTRTVGDVIDPEEVRQRLNVLDIHRRVFRRMFEMMARAGVVEEDGDRFVVKVGQDDPLPDVMPADVDEFADHMSGLYPHGQTEIGLFRRCGGALADVLVGEADPLTLLFSSGEPTAADLYMKAPVARAANQMLADAVAKIIEDLPEGRRLRILEVGAGTGSATAVVLPELPEGRFDYVYTDISAGFFSEAEARFAATGAPLDYRVLDIEKDPIEQGFDSHGYDLVIASNVLHATMYLNETLAHCSDLLAPSGQLVTLENLRGQGWLGLTFGQLDGWWRFADHYRPHHALGSPEIWSWALSDAGFSEIEVLGIDRSESAREPDRGVIMARGPAEVLEPEGVWVLSGDHSGVADELAAALAARNQTVVLANSEQSSDDQSGVTRASVEVENRESWQSLIESLPGNVPLSGVVHLTSMDGRGEDATTEELGEDAKLAAGSALAMVQGITDADATPDRGVWFVTRGGQVLEREHLGQLSGAMLWGMGKVVAREVPHLQPRMIDLDPSGLTPMGDLVNELLYPDSETHIAYRLGLRQAARLVRAADVPERLNLPEDSKWFLEPDAGGALEGLQVLDQPERALEPYEVRVAVEAAGLNFWDVFRALSLIDEGLLGGEMCGYVLEVGSDVTSVSVGDRVVALAFGTFGSESIMHEAMVAPAPSDVPAADLATIPTVFVSAALSYDLAKLKAGDRVLIHAGAGGVGLAAIQLAHAAGAEVFATASAPKQAYLRALGVEHVFDSRQTRFGEQILEATGGGGVNVVLNSLTGPGFIESSLSCLAQGGRFIELARLDIYSPEEMAAARPDVDYHILELDTLKEHYPEQPGDALRRVMKQLEAGEIGPLVHSRWSFTEAGPAMKFMRAARHIGKIVLTNSALETGQLRADRSYLVTGGLGGIGCALAVWLADHGAGAIVLNGRRDPDPEAVEAIEALRERGVRVQVELADVTDTSAVDAMLDRIDASLPPLAGVVHSVGVLSDAALTNQSWDSFQQVLWPKMLGAWHLHRATAHLDLDMFVLFSSVAGIMGNAGQANHAAANAFLDQLAGHRRALGLPGQSVAWGAWSELGEAEEQRERIERQLEAAGTGWISPVQGLRALETLVRQETTAGMVAAVDWPTFAQSHDDAPPFLEDLLATSDEDDSQAAEAPADLMSQLQVTQPIDVESVLATFLQAELQAVMRLPTLPSPSVGFFELGMDSLMAVELRNRLNRAFKGDYVVSNTAVFDYPDVTSLARHLAEELGQSGSAGEPTAAPEPAVPEQRQTVATENDGIAIVGMSCRFPQARDLSEFWQLLASGTDAVTDGRPGAESLTGVNGGSNGEMSKYMRGAYLDDIELFDSRFFRIAPIEARMMDPKQRMILETSWEALEDAGIDPEGLRGSLTGVYAGVGGSEYRDLIESSGKSDSYLGTTASVTVGRIAFALGLEGPAMPIDMACASSLAAVHQAAIALQRGEVDLALAGGVHVVLSEAVNRFMAEVGMLSATGRCSPFDASADGYVRGEGCGMIVLKRLSDAEADGDRIWGIIKGSAVNQNGASAGLTVPNGPAQERVMEAALAQAGIAGADVDYLEAHAVGSQMGDAIEVRAVGAVYGRGRDPGRPLLTGTVKSNMGHLETAAGIAGLIKAVLAMKQGVIPKHLHFDNPNPEIDWDRLPVRVTSSATDWPAGADRPPRAAISAFGISGTNAHMVIEGYGDSAVASDDGVQSFAGPSQPVQAASPGSAAGLIVQEDGLSERKVRLLPLSGKTGGALSDLAKQYLSRLHSGESDESELADMAWMAGVGRSHFAHRAGVVFRDLQSLKSSLKAVAESNGAAGVQSPQPATRVAFVFSGEDSQWAGMGEALYGSEPVATVVLDRCDQLVREARGASLLDVMFGHPGAAGDLDDPSWAQPAVYALQCALTALWAGVGIHPNVVTGDGLGELAAAQAAGILGLDDGLRIALARSAFMADSSNISGLEAALAGTSFAPPSVTFVSSITGQAVDTGTTLDDAYWRRQLDETVSIADISSALAELGMEVVVEIGPEAVLAAEAPGTPVLLASMVKPSEDDPNGSDTSFIKAVAGAYESGLSVSFEGMFSGETRRRISIPTYPFQRRRHWI